MSNVEGMDHLIRRLQAIGDERAILHALQVATVSEAQARVPRKTGFLQRSIRPGPVSRDSAIVRASAPYAAAVEFGTRAHIIRPRTAKVLAWGGPRRLSGRLRKGAKPTNFAKLVHHPGTRAQPYLIPGAKKAVGVLRELIATRWNRA